MVAERSCVLRRWFALESRHDGHVGIATGAVGTGTAACWERTAGRELQDCDSGKGGWCAGHPCDNSFMCLGKPFNFAGDEASWKSWSFVMQSLSAAVSPELRALMEKARTTAEDMRNVNLTLSEQVWGRQERRRGGCRMCQRARVLRR